jgi:transposase
MEHPPYSPDLAPNDFWLFQKIKSALKEPRFQDTEDVQKNVMTALKAILQQEFQKCFNSGSIVGLSAQLLKESTLKVTSLS